MWPMCEVTTPTAEEYGESVGVSMLSISNIHDVTLPSE